MILSRRALLAMIPGIRADESPPETLTCSPEGRWINVGRSALMWHDASQNRITWVASFHGDEMLYARVEELGKVVVLPDGSGKIELAVEPGRPFDSWPKKRGT